MYRGILRANLDVLEKKELRLKQFPIVKQTAVGAVLAV